MTPSKATDHFNYRKASDTEVSNGSNVTKFVTPSQLANKAEATSLLVKMSTNSTLEHWVEYVTSTMAKYGNVTAGYGRTINSSNNLGCIEHTGAGQTPTIKYTTDGFATWNTVKAGNTIGWGSLAGNMCAVSNDLNYYAVMPSNGNTGAIFNRSGTRISSVSTIANAAGSSTPGFKACVFTNNTLVVGWIVNSTTSITIYYIPSPYTQSTPSSFTLTTSFNMSTTIQSINIAGCSGTLNTVIIPIWNNSNVSTFLLVNMSSKSLVGYVNATKQIYNYQATGPNNQYAISPCSGGAFLYGGTNGGRTGYGKPVIRFTNSSIGSIKMTTDNLSIIVQYAYGIIQGVTDIDITSSNNFMLYNANTDTIKYTRNDHDFYLVPSTSSTRLILIRPYTGSTNDTTKVIQVMDGDTLEYASMVELATFNYSHVSKTGFTHVLYRNKVLYYRANGVSKSISNMDLG